MDNQCYFNWHVSIDTEGPLRPSVINYVATREILQQYSAAPSYPIPPALTSIILSTIQSYSSYPDHPDHHVPPVAR